MKVIIDDNIGFRNDGVAQGGIVDDKDGNWYCFVFQDHGAVGRTPVLSTMTWEDGWPVVGVDGKVPRTAKIPVAGHEKKGIVTSDEFINSQIVRSYHNFADTPEELDADTEALLSCARKHLCRLSVLRFQQLDGLSTALPIGVRRIEAMRTLTTESLAVLMLLALPQNQPNAPLYPAGGAPGSRPGALPHFGRPRYLGPPPRARSTAG